MAHNKRDIICKSTIEHHPEDMLRFFYPDAEKIFDFSRGFECDKYGNRVTLLAIYTDRAAERSAAVFESSLFNTGIHFEFKPYKIWEQDEDTLLQSDNPYAFVILIIKSGRSSSQKQRLSKGEAIANCIAEKQFSDFAKLKLLDFMGLYFDFGNIDLRAKFEAIIYTFTIKINNMGIFELKEMFAREEGELKGKVTSAKNMLKLGFDIKVIQEVTELPIRKIKKLAL